jgi:hypothetical protein
MYSDIQVCTCMYRHVPACTSLYREFLYWYVLVCTSMYFHSTKYILVHTSTSRYKSVRLMIYWDIPIQAKTYTSIIHTGTYLYIPVRTSISRCIRFQMGALHWQGASTCFWCTSHSSSSVIALNPSCDCPHFGTTNLHACARANLCARDILKGDFTPLQGI